MAPSACVAAQRRALVVDDDPMNRLLCGTILRKAGFDVSVAGTGEEALAATARAPADLVVLDFMMPGMNGAVAAQRMRAQDAMADAAILLLTASSDQAHIEYGLSCGVDACLTKPVARLTLIAKVESLLRAHAERRAARSSAAAGEASS